MSCLSARLKTPHEWTFCLVPRLFASHASCVGFGCKTKKASGVDFLSWVKTFCISGEVSKVFEQDFQPERMDYALVARHSDDSLLATRPRFVGKPLYVSACADKSINF